MFLLVCIKNVFKPQICFDLGPSTATLSECTCMEKAGKQLLISVRQHQQLPHLTCTAMATFIKLWFTCGSGEVVTSRRRCY